MIVTLLGMVILVRLGKLRNALLRILITVLGMVMLVRLGKLRNAFSGISVTVVFGNTIDTMLCIPLGIIEACTPVKKFPFELLKLADRSRATFFPPECNAVRKSTQPLGMTIDPRLICMGRKTGSVVCAWMYWTSVMFGPVSVWLALREHTLLTSMNSKNEMVGCISVQSPQACPSAGINT